MKRIVAVIAALLIGVAPVAHSLSHGVDDHGTCGTCLTVRSPLPDIPASTHRPFVVFVGLFVADTGQPVPSFPHRFSRPRAPPL